MENIETIDSVCTYCGVGCDIAAHVDTKENKIKKIFAHPDGVVSQGKLCIKGKYGFDFVDDEARLRIPRIKKSFLEKNPDIKEAVAATLSDLDAIWYETTLDGATTACAMKLKEVQAKYGRKSVASIGGARTSCESSYLFQKFTRHTLNSPHVDNCARVCHSPSLRGMRETIGEGAATNPYNDIYNVDFMIVIGSNTTEAHPIIANRIIDVAREKDNLAVFDVREIKLHRFSKYQAIIPHEANLLVLNMLAYVIIDEELYDESFLADRTKGFVDFKEKIMNDPYANPDYFETIEGYEYLSKMIRKVAREYALKKSMIFWGLGITEHIDGSYAVMAITHLALMTGNVGRPGTGLMPLRGQNNVQGAADMGVQPHQGAGYLDVNNPEIQKYYAKKYGIDKMPEQEGLKIPDMLNAAIDGKIKALYIMGEDTIMTDPNTNHSIKAFENLELIVVQELFMTATSEMADVILPASSYFEKNGTFTNGERRVQRVNKVIEPIGNTKPDGQIIIDIMHHLGYNQPTGLKYDAEKVIEEIADVIPFMKGLTWEGLGTNGLQWPIKEDGTDTKMLHVNGEFKKGIGTFHHFNFEETPEIVSHGKKYPFILTTGRELEHYNSGTMTRRTDNQKIVEHDFLEVHPKDAIKKGIKDQETVRIFSDRGSVNITIKYSKNVKRGVLRTTFHQPEVFINLITGSVGDKETLTPEYKVVAVDFEKV
jgi:formate dehydrogenase major subunit